MDIITLGFFIANFVYQKGLEIGNNHWAEIDRQREMAKNVTKRSVSIDPFKRGECFKYTKLQRYQS